MKADSKFVAGDVWEMVYYDSNFHVRIICLDKPGKFPIVVTDDEGNLYAFACSGFNNGRYHLTQKIEPLRYVWANLYPVTSMDFIYDAQEDANTNADPGRRGIIKLAFRGDTLIPSECVIEALS